LGGAEEHGELHAGSHRPVEKWSLFQVAYAVGVEGDVVVAEEHLAGDFYVDGVSVVEQGGGEEGKTGVESEPYQQDAEERGSRARGNCWHRVPV